MAAAADGVAFNGRLNDYFHPRTLAELLLAREFFRRSTYAESASSFVISLHGNRPYALSRRSHPITPFTPSGHFEYRPLIERLSAKVERALAAIPDTQITGRAFYTDATQPWPSEVEDLRAVITSPPFFESTRFYMTNWMRLWFAGWDAADFSVQASRFVDVRQRRSMAVYESVFRQARERLRPDGVVVLHLGASSKRDMAEDLSTIARPWFRTLDLFEEDVRGLERHGVRDKGSVVTHQYLILGR
jgi:hypothetical protein